MIKWSHFEKSQQLCENNYHMSRVMRTTDLCLCENKCADQLCSNCIADQRICFRYTDREIPLLLISKACFCNCTSKFVSDLVGNLEDRFPWVAAHTVKLRRKVTPLCTWSALVSALITITASKVHFVVHTKCTYCYLSSWQYCM